MLNIKEELTDIFNISTIVVLFITLLIKVITFSYLLFYFITENSIISIILIIITILVSLHYLINEILFMNQTPILNQLSTYILSIDESNELISVFSHFNDTINNFVKEETLNYKINYSSIEDTYIYISEYIDIYSKMEKKFNLSKIQNQFYQQIKLWKEKYTNYDFSSLKNKNKNYFKNFDLELKKQFEEMIQITNNIITIIKDSYALDSYIYSIKRMYSYLYCDLFNSFNQRKSIFNENFHPKPKKMITKDNQIIEYSLIKTSNESKNKNLVFFCNPNGMYYEQFSEEKLEYYFDHNNIEILFWNYRGYGLSTGYSNIKNAKEDCLQLFDLIVKQNKYNKILVHGYSIGGICSIYISYMRNIDILVCDRNFANIESIVNGFNIKLNWFIYFLYKCTFFNYSDCVFYILNCKNENCHKIILSDSNDNIVNNFGSIKSGISNYIIKNYIKGNDKKFILDFLLKNNKDKFVNSLIFLSDSNNLDDEKYPDYYSIVKDIKQNFKYFLKSFKNSSEKFENLLDIKNYNCKEKFINQFFNNFFIWGSINEENRFEYNTQNNLSIIENSISILNRLFKKKEKNTFSLLIHVQNIIDCLNILQNNIENINLNKTINKGDLIKLTCGHNGLLDEKECKTFEYFLKKLNFYEEEI